ISPPVIAELQGDAEVVLTQHADSLLQVILGWRGDADLVRLDGGLDTLELLLLQELHDLLGRLRRDALLKCNHTPYRIVRGTLELAGREVLRGDAAPDQPRLQDLPQRGHLELIVGR